MFKYERLIITLEVYILPVIQDKMYQNFARDWAPGRAGPPNLTTICTPHVFSC